MTPLDQAHAAMEAAPEDVAARLRFFERLADSEMFLLLAKDPDGDQIEPETFELTDAKFVLLFDREERLAQFTGRIAPYAALSGRAVVAMLAGQGIGLALNPEVAPSATLLPPEALEWLADTLAHGPAEATVQPQSFHPPKGLPEALLTALDAKLATAAGLASGAYLTGVTYTGGQQSHMLGILDAVPGAESALAGAVNEALTFSGIEAGALDVAFFAASDPLAASLARHGLRFDLPEPPKPEAVRPPPGSDPDNPPKLR